MPRHASLPKQQEAKTTAIAGAKAVVPSVLARRGSTPATKFGANPAIFGRLVNDYDKHRATLSVIEATSPKDSARKHLFAEFVREVHGHAAAQEQAR